VRGHVGEDDIGLIEDFLSSPAGTAQPRSLLVQGDGFAEQENDNGGAHLDFLNNYLFAGLVAASYTDLTPSLVSCPDLTDPSAFIVTDGTTYGVVNSCVTLNDVIDVNGDARVVVDYQNVGVNGPYHAGVEHQNSVTYNWNSLLLGWDMFNTYSRYCATSNGRLSYYYKTLLHEFGALCSNWAPAAATLDVPVNNHGSQFVNFMKISNSVSRNATVSFGVQESGRVRVRLYDVTGRLVRTLADRTMEAGSSQNVMWDGRDDAGSQVARGVYFARIDFARGASINGRVVVLR